MTQTPEMPREIWARTYEADTGHGEWDDYQPFDPGMGQSYIRRAVSKEEAGEVLDALDDFGEFTSTDHVLIVRKLLEAHK